MNKTNARIIKKCNVSWNWAIILNFAVTQKWHTFRYEAFVPLQIICNWKYLDHMYIYPTVVGNVSLSLLSFFVFNGFSKATWELQTSQSALLIPLGSVQFLTDFHSILDYSTDFTYGLVNLVFIGFMEKGWSIMEEVK
jgi:hypothetical protein